MTDSIPEKEMTLAEAIAFIENWNLGSFTNYMNINNTMFAPHQIGIWDVKALEIIFKKMKELKEPMVGK